MLLADLTWPAVAALDKNTPVIFPVAALEQHGRHMPVFTDSMLTNELVRRTEAALGERVLIAPLTWLGNSHHHMDFAGTLSAEPRLYLDLLNGLMENFIAYGFKRLVFLNGHGGNDIPGKQAVSITQAAAAQIARLMARQQSQGLRIGVKKGGCAGMEYTMDYVAEANPLDEVVEQDGARVLIAPMAQMFLFGTEIDYEVDLLQAGFKIRNPNVAEACGCGESIKFKDA